MAGFTNGFTTGFGPTGSDTPPPSPGPPPPVDKSAVWTWVVGAWRTGPDTMLSRAVNKKATWRLTGRHEASFDLDGSDPVALGVEELIDDLWIIRATVPGFGKTIFRGRIGSSNDQADAQVHTTSFSAADYRAVLDRRQLWEGGQLSWLNVDQSDIAWGLLQHTQQQVGGSMGILRGVGQTTGVIRVRNDYPPGKPVGESIDQLSQVINGFDWDVTPNSNPRTNTMSFDIFYPSRGIDRGVILDYGGRISGFSRQVDPGQYANAIRGTGADSTSKGGTLAPVRREASDIATRVEGRWDGQMSDTDLVIQQTIIDRTAKELANRQIVTPSWTVTFVPDGWNGPDDVWLGDPVVLVVRSGRLNVVETLQVQEIQCSWDNNDTVTTQAVLGLVEHPNKRWTLRQVDKRLRALERR